MTGMKSDSPAISDVLATRNVLRITKYGPGLNMQVVYKCVFCRNCPGYAAPLSHQFACTLKIGDM